MQPPDFVPTGDARPHPHGQARVIVAGTTHASGSATVAVILARALKTAGLENASVPVVDGGSTLDSVHAASAQGVWRFVVIAGVSGAALAAAYAMIKAIETRHPGARIEVLVTGHDEFRAHAAYLRVRTATERFLGRDVGFAGVFIDMDGASADGSEQVDSSTRRATRADRTARMWAARLLAECSEGAWPEAAHSMN